MASLLRRVAHDMRSPLTGILGAAEQIASRPGHAASADELAALRAGAGHLLELAEHLLDGAGGGGGRAVAPRPGVSGRAIVREAVGMFRARAAAKGLALDTRWASEGGDATLGDGTLVREVLINLLDNALRHTAEGGVVVACAVERGALTVTITDTGEGIDQGAAGQRDRRLPGRRGLGLALTRELVGSMGGEFEISGAPGSGTSCRVRIPAASVACGSGSAAGAPVLIVDDAPEVCLFVRALLAEAGIDADAAGGPGEALRAAQRPEALYRIVLLDQHLEGGDTVGLARELRALLPTALLVALTGDTAPGAERRYLSAGFDAYLPKPFSPDLLGAILDRVGLREHRAA